MWGYLLLPFIAKGVYECPICKKEIQCEKNVGIFKWDNEIRYVPKGSVAGNLNGPISQAIFPLTICEVNHTEPC